MPNDDQGSPQPFVHNSPPRRPYQAYCVTEASSRPSSPDLFTPFPLKTFPEQAEPRYTARSLSTLRLTCSLATTPPKDEIHEVQPDQRKEHNQNEVHTNHKSPLQDKNKVNKHHITPIVAPRGSHQTASVPAYTYHQTPSLPRMQHSDHPKVTVFEPSKPEPLQQNAEPSIMQHPLPPLPTRTDLVQGNDELRFNISTVECLENARGFTSEKSSEKSTRKPLFPAQITLPALQLQTCKDDRVRPVERVLDVQAQFLPATELHSPRILHSDADAHQRACRRTQPKDAKLKYQFGHRPSLKFVSRFRSPRRDLSSPADFTQHNSTTHLRSDFATSTPFLNVSDDNQAGPRPPPWGSYDILEMQRSVRGEVREREEARSFRSTLDTASSVHKCSVIGQEEGLRREVEEYREQVLRVYPDMTFDGIGGEGGRKSTWCCCVMM